MSLMLTMGLLTTVEISVTLPESHDGSVDYKRTTGSGIGDTKKQMEGSE